MTFTQPTAQNTTSQDFLLELTTPFATIAIKTLDLTNYRQQLHFAFSVVN